MRAVRIGTTLSVGLVLVSCTPPSRQLLPVAAPKAQQVAVAGDTTGLGRLLAQLSDTIAGQSKAVAASSDLEAMLRTLDDTTRGNAILRDNNSAAAQLLAQLGDTLNARNRFDGLSDLESLLRSLDDTALERPLFRGHDAGIASLNNLLKCFDDSATAPNHPR